MELEITTHSSHDQPTTRPLHDADHPSWAARLTDRTGIGHEGELPNNQFERETGYMGYTQKYKILELRSQGIIIMYARTEIQCNDVCVSE